MVRNWEIFRGGLRIRHDEQFAARDGKSQKAMSGLQSWRASQLKIEELRIEGKPSRWQVLVSLVTAVPVLRRLPEWRSKA